MNFIYAILAIMLILILIVIIKRINHKKKKVILQIGPSLKDKGGMVTVMNKIVTSEITSKYSIIHIPTYVYGKKFLLFFSAICHIIFCKIIYRVDLAHIHMASYGSFYRKSIIIKLCTILGIKVILHCHGACFEEFYKKSKNKKYIRNTLNLCKKVIVLSDSWKEFFKDLVDENKIVVMYNSVVLPEKIERKNTNKELTGLFLGRIGKRKGVYDIVKAVKDLKQDGISVKILMAGDGENEKVRKIIKEEKLDDNITILNWIDNKKKEKYLRDVDFYLLPSYNEGLPMSVLEAMSYSLPVVTTDVGGIPEIITNEKNGILIKPGNIEELKNAILKIINNYEFRNNLSNEAYETIKNKFNFENYLVDLDNLYTDIKRKNIKLCLTSSAGGHFMQLKKIFKMAEMYNTTIITEKNEVSTDYKKKYKMRYLIQQERKEFSFIFKFIYNIIKGCIDILINNPDVTISTGAGATTFICLFTKILGGKVIFIESFAKVNSPTVTGKIVYKFADEFYIQWEEMKKVYPDSNYEGGIY